jgi:hypothetical protein
MRERDSILNECEIDFDPIYKDKLRDIVANCENCDIPNEEDDHCVRVTLKDTSTYAYAPRKFALQERKKIREIINNLLA